MIDYVQSNYASQKLYFEKLKEPRKYFIYVLCIRYIKYIKYNIRYTISKMMRMRSFFIRRHNFETFSIELNHITRLSRIL